ncbi:hypothetical protein ACH41H_47210 [Streptomyces sp. NPDC020800]|uniref:hypothetical protein n=1 Tax=Streptomyces sp. NPDC020800 TaxID=3365092 RepID=UPI00379CA0D1
MPAVRIAGAGLAGLAGLAGRTLAHHLHGHGLHVTVCERDPDPTSRKPGYRLHITSTGTTALSRARCTHDQVNCSWPPQASPARTPCCSTSCSPRARPGALAP